MSDLVSSEGSFLAKSLPKSEYDFSIEDQEFEAVKKLAVSSIAEELHVEESRCETLEKMFDFGKSLRSDPPRMEAFFKAKGISVNKTTRENPYNALVKMAFGENLGKAARSQYARTLHFAHVTRLNAPLGDWLKERGIASRYAEASTHFAEPFKKLRGSARHLQIEAGRQKLDKTSLSPAFKISVPQEPGSYCLALVRINSDGDHGTLAAVLETPDVQLDAIFHSHGNAKLASHLALADRPLFHLFRAISLVRSLTHPGLKDAAVLIRSVKGKTAGKSQTIIETTSSEISFPWARVALSDTIDLHGADGLSISLEDANTFVKLFQSSSEWTLAAGTEGTALIADNNAPIHLHPLNPTVEIQVGADLGSKTRHVSLSAVAMIAIDRLKVQTEKFYSSGTRAVSRKPLRFNLEVRGKEIIVSPADGNVAAAIPLLHTNSKIQFVSDRALSGSTIEMVCNALQPYDIDVTGYVANNTQVKDAAIVLEHDFGGDKLEICIPFVISERGDLTPICEPLIQ